MRISGTPLRSSDRRRENFSLALSHNSATRVQCGCVVPNSGRVSRLLADPVAADREDPALDLLRDAPRWFCPSICVKARS